MKLPSGEASGYLIDSFEGISTSFTELEHIAASPTHIVARAKRYGRWWLLKALQPAVAAETAYRQRLRKEFEILMQMQHPSVAGAVGLEHVEGLGLCIILEYIDGTTLGEWLLGKPSRRERLRVACELVDAVAYVHAKNIVHRDLKPDNILITRNGEQVKLIDFGLADTDSHAVLKQPAGTRGYLAPEQAERPVADVRNDIYSLGVLLKQLNLGCPRIVRRCLLPAETRYRHIADLQHALQRRVRRGNRILTAVLTGLVLILAGFAVMQTHLLVVVQTEQKTQQTERQRIEEAIAEGCARIDRTLTESQLREHLDTLSYGLWLMPDYPERFQHILESVEIYMTAVSSDFTEIEQNEIRSALQYHHDTLVAPLVKKLLNVPATPDTQ